MSRKTLFVIGVFLAGVAVACWVGIGMFDADPTYGDGRLLLALMSVALGGFPALLAALPPRAGLFVLGGIAVLLGLWGASVLSIPGDGAIGGVILLFVDVVLVLYGLAVIGLRALIIKNPEA